MFQFCLVGDWIGPEGAVQVKKMPRTSSLAGERRLDNTNSEYFGQYSREPRYFVGIDEMSTFRERIHEIYGDNPEITNAVSQLDEYFSDRSFEKHPEIVSSESISLCSRKFSVDVQYFAVCAEKMSNYTGYCVTMVPSNNPSLLK